MKSKSVKEAKKEVIPIAFNYGNGFDFDHKEHATDDFLSFSNYMLNNYYSPLLARNDELEKCVRELLRVHESVFVLKDTTNGGKEWQDTVTNAKKILNNE